MIRFASFQEHALIGPKTLSYSATASSVHYTCALVLFLVFIVEMFSRTELFDFIDSICFFPRTRFDCSTIGPKTFSYSATAASVHYTCALVLFLIFIVEMFSRTELFDFSDSICFFPRTRFDCSTIGPKTFSYSATASSVHYTCALVLFLIFIVEMFSRTELFDFSDSICFFPRTRFDWSKNPFVFSYCIVSPLHVCIGLVFYFYCGNVFQNRVV